MEKKETKRLYRSSSDRMISGVCGGMAEYFQIDSTLMRLIWVMFTLVAGAGLLLYIAAILIIPLDASEPIKTSKSPADSRTVWGVVLIILGVVLLVGFFNWHIFNWFHVDYWGMFWPAVIIIVGIALILNSGRSRSAAGKRSDVRRLYRIREGRLFLGVAGGTGEYFNLDINLARLIWVLVILISGGLGLLLYLVLYFICPEKPLQAEDTGTASSPETTKNAD